MSTDEFDSAQTPRHGARTVVHRTMNNAIAFVALEAHYELRFVNLFNRGRGYAFPCDAKGHVDLDHLSEHGRDNYFYARAVVGNELSLPLVALVD